MYSVAVVLVLVFCMRLVDGTNYPADDYTSPVNFSLADATKSQVKLHLFTPNAQNTAEIHDANSIVCSKFDRNLPTKFLVHGWTTNLSSPWFEPLKSAYFKHGVCNVIYVDWSVPAGKLYSVSAANVRAVGEIVADFIISAGLKLEGVHFLAHSLGAHMAGFVGKAVLVRTGKRIGRITALDAAGPKFMVTPAGSRLDKDDAEFVDGVHTDDGHYGFSDAFGHADFYPNGGAKQPGCPSLEEDDNCSHARSNLLYIESVTSKDFVAKRANSWEDYLESKCNESAIFGEHVSMKARGKYYFKTNGTQPFALGKES